MFARTQKGTRRQDMAGIRKDLSRKLRQYLGTREDKATEIAKLTVFRRSALTSEN